MTGASGTRLLKILTICQFLGDIGQPLHVEAFEVGGNDINAICNGKSTNLHAVRTFEIDYQVR